MCLVEKHKIPVETVIECLDEFMVKYNIKHKVQVLGLFTGDWNYFEDLLKIVTAKTGKIFKKSRKTSYKQRQEDRAFNEWNDRVISGEIHYDQF